MINPFPGCDSVVRVLLPLLVLLLLSGVDLCYSADEQTRSDPVIIKKYLPYEKWTKEYLEYFRRHYHDSSLALSPRAIVMHFTVSSTFSSAWNTFCNGAMYDDGDVGVIFGHLSTHFIIDRDGTIYQTLPLDRRCRGAYGVNHVAISIEMVSPTEGDLLGNKRLMDSSFRLAAYLVRKFNIPPAHVYGHYEVSAGKKYVPEYTDYGDSKYPGSYPPAYSRRDPGHAYMKKLRDYLREVCP